MKQDAQFALILESIAEINTRLRILDEANARLEAAAEHQLELLESLVTRQEQMLTLLREQSPPVPIESSERQMHETQREPSQNGSGLGSGPSTAAAQASRIIDDNHEYARDTHPALFKVVDLLERDERARDLSVRQLAHETGVSKSWCAIAKQHVLGEKGVH